MKGERNTSTDTGTTDTPAKEITSLVDLVEYAYAQGGRQVTVKASVLDALGKRRPEARPRDDSDAEHGSDHTHDPDPNGSAGGDEDAAQARAAELGATDLLLAVPPRLLARVERSRAQGPLRPRVLRIVNAAVSAHPGLADVRVSSAFREQTNVERLLGEVDEHLRTASPAALHLGEADDKDTLRENVLTTMVLALAMANRWQRAQTVRELDRWVWRGQLSRSRPSPSAGKLAESRSPELFAVVSEAYQTQIRQLERQISHLDDELATATSAGRRAREQNDQTEAALTEALDALDALHEQLADVSRERDEAREQVRVSGVHAVDDFERLRTQMVRLLRDRIKILDDALHAVRNQRYLVVEEFVERSVEDLKRALDALQQDNGGEGRST
jgi:flagellar motility protein MotE (MotC chaperone)